MNEKELADKVKTLTKAVQSNEPASTIIMMIEAIKREPAPSEALLRATKAGVTIGKLRNNPNKDIASAAIAVVRKWKESVEKSKAKKMTNSPKDTPRTTASPAPPSSANQPFKGDPEKRKYDKDGVELGNRTSSTIRNNCIGVIYNGLAFRSRESIESVLEKAMAVEKAAFETYKGETDEYKKKIRSLFQNLKNKTNQDLGRKIMSGEVTPARFVVMTHEELKSAEQKTIDEKLEKENMNKAQVAMPEKSISDALTCGKCQKKKVSYTQAQTRSADEPMTTFCECLECGNRWKFS